MTYCLKRYQEIKGKRFSIHIGSGLFTIGEMSDSYMINIEWYFGDKLNIERYNLEAVVDYIDSGIWILYKVDLRKEKITKLCQSTKK